MTIEIKECQTIDRALMEQVDRSENVEILYEARPSASGLGLELYPIKQEPIIALASWDEAGIDRRILKWQPEIDGGGSLVTAVQNEKILGFGIIGPRHYDDSVELCALFVSSEARQLGVGTVLFQQLETKAKEVGARTLLIYGNPTESSVKFYLKQGCKIIGLADKRLVTHLPWDVVFAKSLGE